MISCPIERKYYDKFRTGYTYREISEMLWSPSSDPAVWHKSNATGYVNKEGKRVGNRRKSILGKWMEIKREMWGRVLREMGGLSNTSYLSKGPKTIRSPFRSPFL